MLLDSIEWLGHSGFRIDARGATIYIDPYRIADGPDRRPDPGDPRPLRPLLAPGRGAGERRAHLAGGAAGGGRARRRAGGVDRAGPAARARAGAGGRGGGRGRLQHLEARRGRPALPPARGRLRGLRPQRARRAPLPRGRHRRDPRDGPGGGGGRRAAAGERDLRDDARARRPRPPAGSSPRWPCRCTGASTSARARTPRSSPSARRWRCGSWSPRAERLPRRPR